MVFNPIVYQRLCDRWIVLAVMSVSVLDRRRMGSKGRKKVRKDGGKKNFLDKEEDGNEREREIVSER